MSADHLSALADAGTKAVIVCPIGFVADHIEVVWDLDNELRAAGRRVAASRSPGPRTPNADRRFARLAVDLIDELRDGREPSRCEARKARMPLRCRAFRSTGRCARPTAGSPSARPSAGSALTAASRAERTTADSGRSASLAICASDELCSPIGINPELTVTIASMCAAFSSTRSARDGAWSGARCWPEDSITCSTSLRGSATSTPPASARMAPSASAADRTADRSANSASPRSTCSAIGAAGSEYTVQLRPDNSASSDSS